MHYLVFELLQQSPFPPDLVPSNCYAIPELKNSLKARKLLSFKEDVVDAVKTWLA